MLQKKKTALPPTDTAFEARAPRRGGPLQIVRRHPVWSVVAILAMVVIAWSAYSGRDASVAQPLLARVEVGDIENAVTAAGFLQPSNFVDVGAQVSGQLDLLHVEVGDSVDKGQLLAEIDATVQFNRVEASRASLRGLEAQLSAREASLALAESNARRQTRLMDDNATTEADFDNAMNALASAQSSLTQLQSQIAQAKASLASDEAQLGYTKIYAPSAGTVVSINMKEGQTLNANQSTPIILRIADLSTMTVEAQVSEADVTKLRPGMEVYFTTLGSGGRRWYSRLRQILPTPTITNNVVLYTALFDVENADKSLFSNMTAQIFFITSSARNVLKVPVGALTFPGGSGRPTSAAASFAGGNARGGAGAGRPDGTQQRMRPPSSGPGAAPGAGGRAANSTSVATVQVLVGPNRFETREIEVGITSRISAEVLSGLEEGDQVVAGIMQSAAEAQQNRRPTFGFR